MFNKRRLALALLSVLAVIGLAVGGYFVYKNVFNKTADAPVGELKKPKTLIQPRSLSEERSKGAKLDPVADAMATAQDNQKNLTNKNYDEVLKSSKSIYENTSLPIGSRVQAYSQCVSASKDSGNTAQLQTCKDAGLAAIEAAKVPYKDEHDYYVFLIRYAAGEVSRDAFAPATEAGIR